jgi:hypothetical protein
MQPELPMKDVTPKKAPPPAKKKAPAKSKAVAVAEPPAQREAKSLLAVIADAAANPNCNPENMRALLDMQKEIMNEQSRRDFNDAFVKLQAELPVIRADRKIEIRKDGRLLQSTPYATFAGISKVIGPLLKKYHFSLAFSTEPMPPPDTRILIRGYLRGYGHETTTAFPLPMEKSGSKNENQAWGSSQSYGKRYCTIALLNIVSEAIEDADTDGHEGNFQRAKGGNLAAITEDPKITTAQHDRLTELLIDAGIERDKFRQRYGLAKVEDLPQRLFMAAQKAIADHKASTGGGKVK